MRHFTITTLSKEILYSNSNPSNVRAFLEEWKVRRPNELLLIHSLASRRFSAIEGCLDLEDDALVYRAMFSPTIENLAVECKSLEIMTKVAQDLEIISSDMSEYETLLLRDAQPGLITKSSILKDARRRQSKLVKILTGCSDCDDEDCEDDCEDDD